ncbi:M15 family metallopeptidase [Bacteroidota bacterium]
MKSYIEIFLLIMFLLFSNACNRNNNAKEVSLENNRTTSSLKASDSLEEIKSKDLKGIPEGLQKLLLAYPEFLDSADENNLYWNDGMKMIYDDGIENKDFESLLNDPDLEDQMSMEYVKGDAYENPPDINFDPGRVRYEPFFLKMYGSSSGEVRGNLVSISWQPNNQKISITSVNNVDEKLQAVANELDELSSDLQKYVKKLGGTFNWRVISGTNRLSMHSFGNAIDINVDYSNYWKWEKPGRDGIYQYKNKIPMEIVEIFEKHGFIWGGKWYHYDTMHFEYRPELLVELEK